MFEVGKYYNITLGTPEEYSSNRVKVIAWEAPLLKYEDRDGRAVVMNTSSPWFFTAEPGPSPEEVEEAEASFRKLMDNLK